MLKPWISCFDAFDDVRACTSIVMCYCECVMSCKFDWYAPLSYICEGCTLTAELGLRISFSPILSFPFSVADLRLKGEWEIRRYDHPCRTSCFGECK